MNWLLWPVRDDELPHQIRLSWSKGRGTVLCVAVSCQCRLLRHGANHFDPMGWLDGDESPWPIYNDPDNHTNDPVPFTYHSQGGPPHMRYKEEDKW